jgi:hypothetical protein
MEPTAQFPFDLTSRARTDQKNEWQQLHREYAMARAQYQATREAADMRPLDLDTMTAALTAAFLAEEQARETLVLSRHRMHSDPHAVAPTHA